MTSHRRTTIAHRLQRAAGLALCVLPLLVAACAQDAAQDVSNHTDFVIPGSETCEAEGMLRIANTATFEQLDDDMRLDRRAAENIVAARPIVTLEALDAVKYVANSALHKIFDYAADQGEFASCNGGGTDEIGIISDLDKTVIPHAEPDLSIAPFPGVTTLYQILEHRNNGAAGDMTYVTARSPDRIGGVPDYLADHGVVEGPIETGISGIPWVAQPEKVKDVSGVLDRTGDQQFLLFGDSSHRDPAVYREIRELYPDRIIAGFIHKVNNTVAPHRVEGLILHEGYHEVAAKLYELDVITRAEAREVMEDAQDEGLDITAADMDDLLDAAEES